MTDNTVSAAVAADLDEAAFKALDALARYKFMMFGYWAAIWVHQNRILPGRRPSPFADLVGLARVMLEKRNA